MGRLRAASAAALCVVHGDTCPLGNGSVNGSLPYWSEGPTFVATALAGMRGMPAPATLPCRAETVREIAARQQRDTPAALAARVAAARAAVAATLPPEPDYGQHGERRPAEAPEPTTAPSTATEPQVPPFDLAEHGLNPGFDQAAAAELLAPEPAPRGAAAPG